MSTELVSTTTFTFYLCILLRYGFKETPKLELVAKPRLGQKEVTLSHVTHWIEKKLCALVDVSWASSHQRSLQHIQLS